LTPASLFGSTGSTNPTRDLINERVAMNGVKRSFEQDGPAAAPATVDHPPSTQNDDMNIDSEDDVARQLRSHENGDPRENSRDVDLSFSVFSQNTSGPTRRRVETDMETKGRVPPGAFISDSDEEVEEERARNKGHKRVSPQPPKRVQDVRVQKQAVREADLGRSLPGSLIVEEEEDGDEDEGHVAPLPASKRPARKGRTLPAGGHEGEGGESKRPRRSTRLSTAHNSVTSPSPESSPKKALLKPSKNTRALSSAAGTAKSGTRKKR
jgi:hypothetical protein